MNSATNDAVYAHITLIEQRLHRALALAVEARAAMAERQRNLAIGTLLPMQEDLSDVAALLQTIFVLHRHSGHAPRRCRMKTRAITLSTLDEDTFFASFGPVRNHLDPHCGFDLGGGGCLFAVTGPEYRYVREQNPLTVWTLIEADGRLYIESGFRIVNRLGYLVTRNPFEPHTATSVPLDP